MRNLVCQNTILAALLLVSALPASADEIETERARLAGIVKELSLTERLTYSAEATAPSETRIHFDYSALRRDLNAVRTGIEEYLQSPSSEPRKVEPIRGDYR
jgi:RAQPRD family integrative conjugative element protein